MKAKKSNLKVLIAALVVVAVGVAIYIYANTYLIKGSLTIMPNVKTIQAPTVQKKLLPAPTLDKKLMPAPTGSTYDPSTTRSMGDPGGGL